MWLKSLQRNDPKKATVTFISFSLQLRKKKIYIFAGLFTIINKIIIRNNWIFLTFNILNFSQIHRIFNPNIFRGTWRNYKPRWLLRFHSHPQIYFCLNWFRPDKSKYNPLQISIIYIYIYRLTVFPAEYTATWKLLDN